jgi:integrase
VHGNITADEARKKAKIVLGQTADGVDVAAQLRQQKQVVRTAPTVSVLADLFLSVEGKKLKPSTRARYEWLLVKVIRPDFGERMVRGIVKGEVKAWHAKLSDTPTQANRALALLSTLFNLAVDDGYRPDRDNPCEGIKRYKEEPRKVYLSEKQLAALGAALREAETVGVPWLVDETKPNAKHLPKRAENRRTKIDPNAAAAIRLFVLTGARLGEILKLEWEHVDLDAGMLRLVDSKTGAKDIVLNAPARAVLAGLPQLAGSSYLIPGEKPGTHRYDLKRPWNMIRRLAALNGVRIHDLRHTNAAVAVASNVSLRLIGGLLGHASEQTSARYAHLSDDPLRDAAEKIGSRIERAMGEGQVKPSVNVRPLRKPAS